MAAEIIPMHYGALPADWAHLDGLLGLTEDLLPVVSNPRAVIASTSSISSLGKLPSTYNAQGLVVGFAAWTQYRAGPADIARWALARDYGICIQTRRVRAIDVDVSDSALAAAIAEHLEGRRKFPIRGRGGSSKFLVAFELRGEFGKRRFETEHGFVEFLANGQQFVAVGTHPTGHRYYWSDGALPDSLPELVEAEFEDIWRGLIERFAKPGSAVEASASTRAQRLSDVVQQDPVARHLLAQPGRVRKAERDGRLHIVCPWADDHSSDSETSTTYWPAHTGGYERGHFHCFHAHCADHTDAEFLEAVGYREVDPFELAPIEDEPGPETVPPALGLDAAAPRPKGRFSVLEAHEFADAPPPAWLIKGVLPRADLAVLYGASGAGKSFIALDMALALSQGLAWRGLRTEQCRVVYLAAEGVGGVRKRLKAAARNLDISLRDIKLKVVADGLSLLEQGDVVALGRAIHEAGGADLVIIDTLAQTTAGANENSGEDMSQALANCRGLQRMLGCMVMLIHHAGKDLAKGARGWSGLRAAADVELEVSRQDCGRTLTITKQKDGDDQASFAFRLEVVVVGFDDEGDEVSSCVVVHEAGEPVAKTSAAVGSNQRALLEQVELLGGVENNWVAEKALIEGAKAVIPGSEGARDTRRQRLLTALGQLVASNKLEKGSAGYRLRFGQ